MPRSAVAVLFAGSYVSSAMVAEARQLALPLLVLPQWGDEGNNRWLTSDLLAIGSKVTTLRENVGGRTGVPQFEADTGDRSFARHLR